MNVRSFDEWLESVELAQYAKLFAENEVDFKTLEILTEADLKELGLPFGPRKRLLRALADLKGEDSTPHTGMVAVGERRQLTVMFCDMVGFTELAGRVDPEVLQTVIGRYEDACAGCIERYDGYVFQRLGDGIVAFFGYPAAHEGEAERAIHAALEIVKALAALDIPDVGRLKVRIGIAAGVVVVTSGEKGAVGETMSLAARLQAVAEPGSVVVSEQVHRLAGGVFDYADLGALRLKGIAQPAQAYRVVGVSAAASRFDAAAQQGLTPLVGRDQELELLFERWGVAQGGSGQVVLLSGEPGIGKSRIVSALRERLEAQGVEPIRYQCSPYAMNSAFYPSIDNLERTLRFSRDDLPAQKLDKLEALVVGRYGRPREDARFLATILSIPSEDRYGPSALTPRQQKDETTRALVDLTEAAARARPSIMLFEDAHWADPTSLDVLDILLGRVSGVPLLVVLTFRPEFQSRWHEMEHVREVPLSKFTRAQGSALVSRVTGGKALPPELLERILDKTDGVPLFVEELTKTILESGELRDAGDRYVYAGKAAGVTIPATLRDSLMARLDRVPAVKEIAQVGATIGREFSYELLTAVAPMGETRLNDGLLRLTDSGLATQRGAIPQAIYTFKHALVQDAAYDSLLKSRRLELHGEIARVLEERWPETKESEPELLARHYTEARLDDLAVPYWRRAGEVAVGRFALREAVAHLEKGLALVEARPAAPARDLTALELRTLLAPAVSALHGWASPEVSAMLRPAWTLAESLEHRKSYLPILHGLWVHTLTLGEHVDSMGWAEKLLASGDASNDPDLEICGHRAAMASLFWMGDLLGARRHGDRIRELYDADRHRNIAALTNSDPLTAEGYYRGQIEWMLGYPDRAARMSDEKDEHARRRNHPFDVGFALTVGAQVYDYRGEPDKLLARAEEAERYCREHRIPLMSEAMAQIVKGVAWLLAGRVADSLPQMREALSRLDRTGHRAWVLYVRAHIGEALALSGDIPGGLVLLEESIEQAERCAERVHLAEVLRLKGWMLDRQGKTADAESVLREAIALARRQQAKSWELRASTTLARMLAGRGECSEAKALLEPVYGWFTEGLDTKDLMEARGLLDGLRD
jgi:class 3 adenylate cyclase/tetratricopeptide (TPR) repeat protein